MDVLLFTQSSLVGHIGCLQNGCCIYLQLWVEREGVVWYTRVMTLLPSFSLRIDLQNWSRSSCPSGQRQGWDGSPGLSTTASQGLLEAFQETYPVGSAHLEWRIQMERSSGAVWQASGHQAKLSHCDLDLPASGTALSKPVLEVFLMKVTLQALFRNWSQTSLAGESSIFRSLSSLHLGQSFTSPPGILQGEKRRRPHRETGVWSVHPKETQGQVTELVLALESALDAK